MLFAGSTNAKIHTLGEGKRVILNLAIGATLMGALFTGLTSWWLLGMLGIGLGLIFALVFGALISPTDLIAALAILGKVGPPPRLEAIVNGESLFNDGVGVVIFTICLTIALGTQQPTAMDAAIMFLREVLGGIALGIVAADTMHRTLARTSDYGLWHPRADLRGTRVAGLRHRRGHGGVRADRHGRDRPVELGRDAWGAGCRHGHVASRRSGEGGDPAHDLWRGDLFHQGLTISRFFEADRLNRLWDSPAVLKRHPRL